MHFFGYTIGEKLAEHRTGALYRALRQADDRPVLLTISAPGLARDAAQHSFSHELAILETLGQDDVGMAVGIVVDHLHTALCLLPCEEQPLSLWLGPEMPIEQFTRFAIQIAETLSRIHRRGIIHRNLSPQSIFIHPESGHARFFDFSLACPIADARPFNKPRSALTYIAPEQTGRMGRPVDHRADLYSLGILFYEMLSGRAPFSDRDPVALVHAHIAQEPADLCALRLGTPLPLKRIIDKLLAKNAEDRYRSALSLLSDIRRAEALLLEENGQGGQAFIAGEWERGPALSIPHTLYGRSRERESLQNAMEQAVLGDTVAVFIEGLGGTGKTSLVQMFEPTIAAQGAYYVQTHSEPINRMLPFTAVISLMDKLCCQVIEQAGDTEREAWIAALSQAFGPGVSTLPSILPSLGEVFPVGSARSATVSSPDLQKRIERSLLCVLSATAGPGHPVVLFLDDLHWMDSATMRFIQTAASDPSIHHCLILCAVRGADFDGAHPLSKTKAYIEQHGGLVRTLMTEPLSQQHVEQLLVDTLGRPVSEIKPLASEVYVHTRGNPFFIQAFLRWLQERSFLVFNDATEQWSWSLDKIRGAEVPEDAAEFLMSELRRLPAHTRYLLESASCLGTQFDMHMLAIACNLPIGEVKDGLQDALSKNLLIPASNIHKPSPWAPPGAKAEKTWVQFPHERVRQAAYGLLSGEDILSLRLQIGRRLRDAARARPGENELHRLVLDFVDHLNTGAAPLEDESELAELAALNLIAGQRAKENAAYEVASRYFAMGGLLVPADSSDELRFELHISEAECEYFRGDPRHAELLLERLPVPAPGESAIARVASLRMAAKNVLGRSVEAIMAGLEGLSALGIPIEDDEEKARDAAAALHAQVRKWLSEHSIEELLDRPGLIDSRLRAIQKILADLCAPSALVRPALCSYAVGLLTSLSMEHGNSPESSHAYMLYGMHLAVSLGRYQEAAEFGRLALKLDGRQGMGESHGRLHYLFGTFAHFFEPLPIVLTHFRKAHTDSLGAGDPITASYACLHILLARLSMGDPLDSIEEECRSFSGQIQQMKAASQVAMHTLINRVILHLKGLVPSPGSLSGEDFDEVSFAASLLKSGLQLPLGFYKAEKQKLDYFRDRHEEAVAIAADQLAKPAAWLYTMIDICFYGCLSLIKLMEAKPKDDAEYRTLFDLWYEKVKSWARACPSNYRCHELIVAAELARISGDELPASTLFDQAYEHAVGEGLAPMEALSAELSARFHWNAGRNSTASAMMANASAAYTGWGAFSHIERLRKRYARLFRPRVSKRALPRGVVPSLPPDSLGGATASGLSVPLDFLSVIRASQALFVEVGLSPLLDTIMRIVLENAGAEWGVLLLARNGSLFVAAQMPVRQDSQDPNIFVPMSLIQFVHLSAEPVVMADALRDNPLLDEAYLRRYRPRSVFCLPLRLQGESVGVLCLENSLAAGAFTVDRTEVLRLLGTQIAISIRNAMAYEELVEARRAAEAANRAKSAFLASMSHELRTPLNAILGYSELLIENAEEENARHWIADLAKIQSAGQHLLDLINNILDLSKIEANKMQIAVERVALQQIFGALSTTLAPLFAQNDNRFIVDAAADLGTIESDPLRIKQILMNVLSNATKFTHSGLIRLRAFRDEAVDFQGSGIHSRVVFEISDTGIGMSEEQLAHIFDAFHQVDNSTSRRYGGTGLGLTITRSLCRLLGGDILVKSELGVGTTFTIVLPEALALPAQNAISH